MKLTLDKNLFDKATNYLKQMEVESMDIDDMSIISRIQKHKKELNRFKDHFEHEEEMKRYEEEDEYEVPIKQL